MYAATVESGTRKIAIVGNMGSPDLDTNTITGGELNIIDGGAYGNQAGTDFKTPLVEPVSEKFELVSGSTSHSKW